MFFIKDIIRINKNLYIKGTYDGTLAYYPIDRLESFETYNSIEPSIPPSLAKNIKIIAIKIIIQVCDNLMELNR